MFWVYQPKSFQNLARFTAPDPWNGSRPAVFELERCFSRSVLPNTYEQEARPHKYAIRSGIDRQCRILPDSLTALWKDRRIDAERLPALLKSMEPDLIRSDYVR